MGNGEDRCVYYCEIGPKPICGRGGYAINAAMTERRIKVVGTVTGANYGRLMRGGFANLDPIGLEKISKQRTAEARGAEWHVDDLLPLSVEAASKISMCWRRQITICSELRT
jgi:hypothetical protein